MRCSRPGKGSLTSYQVSGWYSACLVAVPLQLHNACGTALLLRRLLLLSCQAALEAVHHSLWRHAVYLLHHARHLQHICNNSTM
jgi:hypothetical protein